MLNKILGLLILLGSLVAGWVMMDYRQFIESSLQIPAAGAVYDLRPGSTIKTVADELHRRGYLRKPLYLRVLARWEGSAKRIKAGEYQLTSGLRPRELLSLLTSGRVISYTLTLVEGWEFRQVMEAVGAHTALVHTLEALSHDAIMEALGASGQHPEGLFLPDTYQFPRGTTDRDFLRRAYDAMQRLLEKEWVTRREGLPLETPYDALILASIVEKETGLASERPMIAGAFVRRLEKGMKLQTDPTVIYAMGEEFNGNITRRDLRRDSPYNTYVYKGLPPTPICMPGPDAIRAVLHPQDGDALYFVAKGDGSHHFSATLEEHNRAVRKYQLRR